MKSILGEISILRNGKPLTIDKGNRNRYRVVAMEDDGSQTSYFFATPIYNEQTRKSVDMRFHADCGAFVCVGSNAKVTVGNSVRMENGIGSCEISLPEAPLTYADGFLTCGSLVLMPTTNGIAIRTYMTNGAETSFVLEVDTPHLDIHTNGKCLALMCEKFKPFLVASCIGTEDQTGAVIAPAALSCQRLGSRKYLLSVLPEVMPGTSVLLEINLYEQKLFQDTTVESHSPNTNNVFGTVCFLGTTPAFGEQWLYTKPDYQKLLEIEERRINSAVLHIPHYAKEGPELDAYSIALRFCSFGSTWNNRIPESQRFASAQLHAGYFSIDLSAIFRDSGGRLLKHNGLILRTRHKASGEAIIPTADSCFLPQIFEVNCR